jgi:ribosomal protein L16/L10AE
MSSSSTIAALICPDCGRPMRTYQQQGAAGRPAYTLAECKNKRCDLNDVTLSERHWSQITNEQLEAYRQVVRRLRAS